MRCLAMKGEPSMIGDRLCQGFNNNEECDFDGMDCCHPVIDDSLCHDVMCRCHLTGLNWTLFVVLFVCTRVWISIIEALKPSISTHSKPRTRLLKCFALQHSVM